METQKTKSKRKRSPSPVDKKNKQKNRSPSPVNITPAKRSRVPRKSNVLNTSTTTTTSSRKKAKEKINNTVNNEDNEDLTKDMENPKPDVVLQEVQIQKTTTTIGKTKQDNELQPIKGGNLMELDTIPDKTSSANDQIPKEKTTEVLADEVTQQSSYIIVPSYSSWFDYNCIHTVERRALPEFFNCKNKSKSAEIYLAYRNFMIDTYRLSPTEYLTVTACRRNLAGDVCTIMRVHAFLEQWGLINYQVDADSRPAPMGPPSTSHFHVLVDSPAGVQPLPSSTHINNQDSKKEGQVQENTEPIQNGKALATSQILNLSDDKNSANKNDKINGDKFNDNFGLRLDQFAKKREYFKKNVAATVQREWTEQEILLLLEAVELYKDDWNSVCEHVGRTQDECILQFLRLPIEDPYLEDGESAIGPLAYQPIPFSKSGNPIMSTVAFLASVVDPRIASVAAKSAMEEFAKMKDELPTSLNEDKMTNSKESSIKENNQDDLNDLNKDDKQETSTQKEAIKLEDKSEVKDDEDKIQSNDKSMEADAELNGNKESQQSQQKDSSATIKESTNKDETSKKESKEKDKAIKEHQVAKAAAAVLGSVAVKAKHLAAVEERKIKSLVALINETQLKKLTIKMKYFEELEDMLDKEKETVI